jgi:CRISPR-associated protein Cmr4
MYTSATVFGLYTETYVHAGTGSSAGVIDLPIQRERHTLFPTLWGSGLKGVVRDVAKRTWAENKDVGGENEKALRVNGDAGVLVVFGPEPDKGDAIDHAGAVSFSDARILAFPVRSVPGPFVWVTCPFALDRLRRDVGDSESERVPQVEEVGAGEALCPKGGSAGFGDRLVLEEYDYAVKPEAKVDTLASTFASFMPASEAYSPFQERLKKRLVVLADNEFQHFVTRSTEVVTRVRLNERKTTTGDGGNMWVEELLPSDCLLYSIALASDSRREGARLKASEVSRVVRELLEARPRLQVGGDCSVGRGWVVVTRVPWKERQS